MATSHHSRRRNSQPASSNQREGESQIRRHMEVQIETVMKAKAYRRFEGNNFSTEPETEDLEISVIPKTSECQDIIMGALRKNILFNNYSEEQLLNVMKALKPKKVKKGDKVINKGEQGYNFYVIRDGEFSFSNGKIFGKEYCFGELALLFDSPRLLSVQCASEQGELYYLNRPVFQAILAKTRLDSEGDMVNRLENVDILKGTPREKLVEIFQKGHFQTYNKNDMVVEKGTESRFFYIILEGRVRVSNLESESMISTELGELEYFGESTLTQKVRRANVEVISAKASLLVLERSLLLEKNILQKLMRLDFKVLHSIFVFNILNRESKNRIKEAVTAFTTSGSASVSVPRDEVFIIKKGMAEGKTGGLRAGSFINVDKEEKEIQIISDEFQYYSINKVFFKSIFDNLCNYEERIQVFASDDKNYSPNVDLIQYLKQCQNDIAKFATNKKRSFKFNRDFSSLDNFKSIRLLGQGGYGAVTLVQNLFNKQYYALKEVNIEKIVNKNFEGNILNEKNVLLYCKHPFILKLHQTLKDFNNFYFLFETVLGGDLYGYLYETRPCMTCGQNPQQCHHNPTLPINETRFFMACVVEAFDYLHMNNIIYRDLKLENLMIDDYGYIKVVDFGFAKKMVTARTRTTCGTVDYMAPELLLKSGHDRAVDVWAIGVLLYELLVGYPAFSKTRDPAERDQNTIFRNITKVKYRSNIEDEHAARMVAGIFVKLPRKRLGMSGNRLCALKNHRFFAGMDWEELREKRIKPPCFVPQLEDELDTKYFGETISESASAPSSTLSDAKSRIASLKKKGWYNEF